MSWHNVKSLSDTESSRSLSQWWGQAEAVLARRERASEGSFQSRKLRVAQDCGYGRHADRNAEITRLVMGGLSYSAAAERFGLSTKTIHNIVNEARAG